MKPHQPGEYVRRARRQVMKDAKKQIVKAVRTAIKHPAKAKPKRAPRLKDQTLQFSGVKANVLKPGVKPPRTGFRVTESMLARARSNMRQSRVLAEVVFSCAKPMPGVVPAGKATLAMDENIETAIGWAAQSIYNGAFQQGVAFLGYPYLAELAQRAEYRRVSEVIATEMTRKWIEIKCHNTTANTADGPELAQDAFPPAKPDAPAEKPQQGADKPAVDPNAAPGEEPADPKAELASQLKQVIAEVKDQRVKDLEDEFERLNVQAAFKELAEQDGFFGRSHLFLDVSLPNMDSADDPNELKMPIGNGSDPVSEAKIQKGMVKRLKTVEAIWCYPSNYNSSNPLRRDWYKPTMWFVQGMEVHASRLLTFVGREVPDMLKPAYSFGGLSLSQMVQPTVLNWLRTRQSVSDIIHAFSVFVLKTNLGTSIQEDGDEVFKRADFFNQVRDNRGLMMIDKDSEDFANVSAPITGLDALQAQSQEHICSVSGLPLVKYTGISPSGLNATSEFEIASFYDWIKAFQIAFFKPNLTRIFHIAQLNIWGKVDPDLYFEFQPLAEQTEKEKADTRKTEADTDKVYVDAGVIDPVEVRTRLSNDPDGPYAGIPPEDVPEPPEQEMGPQGFDPNNPDGPPGPDEGTAEPEA